MFYCRLYFFINIVQLVSSYTFTNDNWNSFDAYGVKLAINDAVVVQARNRDARFVLQFGPFITSNLSSPCSVDYVGITSSDNNFIYSLVIPKQVSQDASVIFIGENDDYSTSPYPFIGHLRVNSSCTATYDIQYFNSSGHDEFFIVGVDPTGQRAYGFSSRFAFSYNLQTHTITYLQQWPISNFMPHAIDVSSDYVAVIAGFLNQGQNIYRPLVYMLMLNISSLSVLDTWEYTPSNSSWQATTLNTDAGYYTEKHIMSVSIESNTSQVLIGMPSMNIVFWFSMMTNLTLLAYRENGNQRGYGQSLGWSNEVAGPYPILLGNTYSFPYTWSTSIIYWFTPEEFRSSNPIMPLFPTIQCPQWIELKPKLLTIAVATLSVAFLDSSGQIYVIVGAPMGTYPDTSVTIGFNPAFSIPKSCPAGTYKDWIGIYICYLCPFGTMSVSEGSIECSPYNCTDNNSFCPLGSTTNDTYSDLNIFVFDQLAYPESPDTTNIDDILINNMFTFGNSSSCLIISPLFWSMIMTAIAMMIIIFMGFLKFCKQYTKVRHTLKRIFRQADLIGEGEVWVGGLASLALIVLLIFAYTFSSAFLKQYPIETVSPSAFICDTTIRNAQFETQLKSLTTPVSEDDEPIFKLLDEQQFILTIDFINTQQKCNQLQVIQTIHGNPKTIAFNCTYYRSMLSVSIVLQSHTFFMNYNFQNAQTIGGFRISLYGKQHETSSTDGKYNYMVRELNYSQPFFVNNQTLSYDPNVEIRLTRVINKTEPLDDASSEYYTALWAPTSPTSKPDLFLTFDDYLYYGLLKTSLTISTTEISYYIMNNQKPIVKQAEIIFHALLFTTVCIELFGLVYLAIKLIFLPMFHRIRTFVEKHSNVVHPDHSSKSSETFVSTIQELVPPPPPSSPRPPPYVLLSKRHAKPIHRSTNTKKLPTVKSRPKK
ncbi:unnamed protein product [Adineta steineri]|uniref:Uncharacterized protein n=1 Tax=Adineta steineri TaxID=433720 RepID=A0A813QLS8_9BILA|nr:unnamed protein product [Adineta steineri]CAF3947287.1 unnamed protein product [Adineta steineri]